MSRHLKAKDISGAVLQIYTLRARRAGYHSWKEYIDDLQLQDELALEAFWVLQDILHDMEELHTIQ